MPMPVSLTSKTRSMRRPGISSSPGAAARARSVTSPCSVNLTAFEARLIRSAGSAGVTEQHCGHVGLAVGQQLEAFGGRRRTEQHTDVLDQLPRVEVDLLELDLVGFQLGEVEDVVDDPQQRLPGAADAGDVALLDGVERGVEKKLGQPDHAVHRGANLVAHGGEELGLLAGTVQGLGARGHQLGVPHQSLADVASDGG
jgi:hypothetical protein